MRAGRLFVAVVLLCMSMICRAGKGGADVKIAYSADNGRYYATVSRRNESRKVGLGAEKMSWGCPRCIVVHRTIFRESLRIAVCTYRTISETGRQNIFSPAGFMHFVIWAR